MLPYKTAESRKALVNDTNIHFIKIKFIISLVFSQYLCHVANSFSKQVIYNKRSLLAVVVPELRKDGMYYEVNVNGFPRFFMTWSQLGRFDIVDEAAKDIPYELVLAVSDAIESRTKRR
jgi:hypothetical protein